MPQSYHVECYISEEQLRARVKELAHEIAADHGDTPLLVVCVLKGSMIFFADLVRALPGDIRLDTIAVSSYGDGQVSSGKVRLVSDISQSIEGHHVLLVEDIIDSGRTMKHLLELLEERNPASLKVVALLSKPSRRTVDVPIQYIGFTIEDDFVVGYGLDFAEKYRALPFIGALKNDESTTFE